jgi:hypothetical protein
LFANLKRLASAVQLRPAAPYFQRVATSKNFILSQLVTKQILALLKFVSIQVRTIQSRAPSRGATNPQTI